MRILIANPFGIGDVLFSLPLLHALREQEPNGFLGYLCNRRTQEMVESWPLLDWTTVFEKDEFRAQWGRSKRRGLGLLSRLLRDIQSRRFDALIDLSLGWHVGLGGLLAGIPERVGFDFRQRGRFLTRRLVIQGFQDRPVAEYFLDLLPLLGFLLPRRIQRSFPLPKSIESEADRYLESIGSSGGDRWVGVVPGGGASWGRQASFKQWPPPHFSRIADRIGQRYEAKIVLIGDASEAALCRNVASGMRRKALLATGVPSLLLLAALLKRSEMVLGNDSGPMHLAASMGTKTVSLFGPVDGSVYGPFPARESYGSHRVVSKGLACRPCYRGFRFPPCPWENGCLRELSVEEVWEAVVDLMETQGGKNGSH